MDKPKYHIFVCGSFRVNGEAQGICNKKGALGLIPYIEEGLRDRDIDGTMVSMTGCLKVCDRGPAMVIYPNNFWYGRVENESVIDDILDALERGEAAQKYLIA